MKKIEFYFIALGVGLGMTVSGIALKIHPAPVAKMSDQEIVERARELGMVGIKEHIESSSQDDDEKNAPESEVPTEVRVEVQRGENSEAIAEKLLSSNLIKSADDFLAFVYEKNAQNKFREGTYMVESGSSNDAILSILTKGAY